VFCINKDVFPHSDASCLPTQQFHGMQLLVSVGTYERDSMEMEESISYLFMILNLPIVSWTSRFFVNMEKFSHESFQHLPEKHGHEKVKSSIHHQVSHNILIYYDQHQQSAPATEFQERPSYRATQISTATPYRTTGRAIGGSFC
jgi:hypothetical protein